MFLPSQYGGRTCLGPTPADRRELLARLWLVGSPHRPQIGQRVAREVHEAFDYRCARCRTRRLPLQLHHIVPWREAVLRFDGRHDAPENLIPLCTGGCHASADQERISRLDLFALRGIPQHERVRIERTRATSSEFDAGIVLANHRQLQQALAHDSTAATHRKHVIQIIQAASAARRWNVDQTLALLHDAEGLAHARDHAARAQISYEHGKVAILQHRFREAAAYFKTSASLAEDPVLFKKAKYSEMSSILRSEVHGGLAPQVALDPHCGIAQFKVYGNGARASFSGAKWYVYGLLDYGEYWATVGEPTKALDVLAEAERWIDGLGMKAVRRQLYTRLAYAFCARGDFWRMTLAASAALAMHATLGLPEHQGVAVLTYIDGLKHLDLKRAIPRVGRSRINPDMDNKWALTRIGQALAAAA